ncbi:MAG: hypothetical protein WBC13_01625 [Dokdonella sp.]
MFVFRSTIRPRNPLLRLLGGILGFLAVLAVLALGLFAFAALVVGGAIWFVVNQLRGGRRPAPLTNPRGQDADVIDGEFSIVGNPAPQVLITQDNRQTPNRS